MSAARAKRGSAAVGAPEQEAGLDVEQRLAEERHRQTQARLAATQAAYDALCAEHAALQERRRAEEAEAAEAAGSLRSELAAQTTRLAAAQAELAGAAQWLADAQAAAEAREAALRQQWAAEREAAAATAAGLQARLDSLAEFQAQREAMTAEMQRLRADNAYIAQEAGDRVRALQVRLRELEGKSGSGGGAGAGEAEEDGGGEGPGGEAEMARLLAHSRKAAVEIQQYGKEAEELQREMAALEAERAGLLRDAALRADMEQAYAKRGTLQAREIRSAHTKISSLEKGLVRMAADFEAEKVALEARLRARLDAALAEGAGLRRLLAVRSRELRGLRRAAQEVLAQRSDVEAFLVASIQQVRAELMAQAGSGAGGSAAAPSAAATAGSQPALGGSSGGSVLPASPQRSASAASASASGAAGDANDAVGQGGEGSAPAGAGSGGSSGLPGGYSSSLGTAVDVRELSWQDRERILRLLFSRINRAAAAAPPVARAAALSEVQVEAPLRGLPAATEAGPAGLA